MPVASAVKSKIPKMRKKMSSRLSKALAPEKPQGNRMNAIHGRFYRAGGAMFISPALQRWEAGPTEGSAPLGALAGGNDLRGQTIQLSHPTVRGPRGKVLVRR